MTLNGAVAKGPFVLGSQVEVEPVDASGNPSGQNFNTDTTDNEGRFSLTFSYQGPVQLNATGYYYNEVQGALSTSQLTLNGLANVSQSGTQNGFINTVTHLEYQRVKALMGQGMSLSDASTAADTALFPALSIGGTSFNPGASGAQMSIVDGDSDANAYLLAVSSVFAEAAWIETNGLNGSPGSGSIDANLTSILNSAAAGFASGTVDSTTLSELAQAQAEVEPNQIIGQLVTHYDGGISLPDINRALDSDGDGIANAQDSCVLQANIDQATVPPGVCTYRSAALTIVNTQGSNFADAWISGDIDGDGVADLLFLNPTASAFLVNPDGGGPGAPITVALTSKLGLTSSTFPTFYNGQLVDVNGDTHADVVLSYSVQNSGGPGQVSHVRYLPGDGTGNFGAAQDLASIAVGSGNSGPPGTDAGPVAVGFGLIAMGDVDGHSGVDLIGTAQAANGGSNGYSTSMALVSLGYDDGGLAPPVGYAYPNAPGNSAIPVNGLVTGDFNGDGSLDFAVSVGGFPGQPGGFGGVYVFLNRADHTGTFDVAIVSSLATTSVTGLVTGDFDNDGILDLAVADTCGTGTNYVVYVLYGNGVAVGDGTFGAATTLTIPPPPGQQNTGSCGGPGEPSALTAADYDGDGRVDLLTTVGGETGVLASFGRGMFTSLQPIRLTWQGTGNSGDATNQNNFLPSWAVADLDRNGTMDFVSPLTNATFEINPTGYTSW